MYLSYIILSMGHANYASVLENERSLIYFAKYLPKYAVHVSLFHLQENRYLHHAELYIVSEH